MKEFDVLLTDISRVIIEITRTKTMNLGLTPKMDQQNYIFPQYC